MCYHSKDECTFHKMSSHSHKYFRVKKRELKIGVLVRLDLQRSPSHSGFFSKLFGFCPKLSPSQRFPKHLGPSPSFLLRRREREEDQHLIIFHHLKIGSFLYFVFGHGKRKSDKGNLSKIFGPSASSRKRTMPSCSQSQDFRRTIRKISLTHSIPLARKFKVEMKHPNLYWKL